MWKLASTGNIVNEDQARQIWAILVEYCDAPGDSDMESAFVDYLVSTPRAEFRFQGNLEFGGKLYVNGNGIYVAYYKEHKNDEREKAKCMANKKIAELVQQWQKES